ncbi:MAG TPA: hypothetical protein VH170_04035 [Chthoniobacterales bacterium]|jgi:hypothetical protein|nr:hypothetical protein [Chthoniobacterales bacterium]
MKETTLAKILAVACGLVAVTAVAQTSTTVTTKDAAAGTAVTETSTSTMNGSGTITAYTPGSDYITFRSETSAEPVKYYYTKKTVLVDPSGRTVEWSALKPDMPVTYTYVKEGDRMVVSKVTLAKPIVTEKETTTTTTTTKP